MDAQTARTVLLAKGLPVELLDAIVLRQRPFSLLSWREPDFAFAKALEDLATDLRGMCPIAEQNGEAVVALLPETDTFISYYYEDGREGNAAITILAKGYRQFAAGILVGFEESGLRDELMEAAVILRFQELGQLLELLDAEPYDDDALESFISRLASRA